MSRTAVVMIKRRIMNSKMNISFTFGKFLGEKPLAAVIDSVDKMTPLGLVYLVLLFAI